MSKTESQAPEQTVTIKDAQQIVDNWINTIGVRYFSELTNLGILMEEVDWLVRAK